jgi:hypothetical protein
MTDLILPERNEDFSIYYWLNEKFPDVVSIVKSFPTKLLSTPTISISWENIKGYPLEIGNREVLKERLWYFDVFASNETQRDDICYKLFNDLTNGIPVKDYNSGFPPLVVNQTQINTLVPVEREIRNLHEYIETVDEHETQYYRAVVLFTATLTNF